MISRQNKKSVLLTLTVLLAQVAIAASLSIGALHTARADFSCSDVTNPTSTKGWIVTILEEQIGQPSTTDVSPAVNCFRQSTCAPPSGSSSTATCSPANPEYVTSCTANATTECDPVQVYFAQSGATLLFSYVSRIYKWAATTIGIISVLYLTWGGIELSTAQGDGGKIEKAKERIMQSLGGLVLLFLSALILYTINPNFFTAS